MTIYNKYSMVGILLWVGYGLMADRPLAPLSETYAQYLESPGTQGLYKTGSRRVLFRVRRHQNRNGADAWGSAGRRSGTKACGTGSVVGARPVATRNHPLAVSAAGFTHAH